MFGITAYYSYFTFSHDYFAFIAHLFYGWSNFHMSCFYLLFAYSIIYCIMMLYFSEIMYVCICFAVSMATPTKINKDVAPNP